MRYRPFWYALGIFQDLEKIKAIIVRKKALMKTSRDVYEFDRLVSELDGLEWLQRQIARYS